MKVLNITKHYSSYNYGAMLQAYALQCACKELCDEYKIIDYRTDDIKPRYSLRSPTQAFNYLSYMLNRKECQACYDKFEMFVIDYLEKTPICSTYEDMKKVCSDADCVIVGSDQVWNPGKISDYNFLRFVPKEKIKASYAASLGISNIPYGTRNVLSNYLSAFDYVSVREKDAKKILVDYYDRDINVNIDPTLLLSANEWRRLAVLPQLKKPYILCYCLYRPSWLNKFLKKIHKQTGKDIVLISVDPFRNIYHNKMVHDAGPLEYLGLIENADFIISSAFHGVALSIAMEKDFYAVVDPTMPSRLIDLLELMDLKDRVVDPSIPFSFSKVDFQKSQRVIALERKKSEDYLKQVFSGNQKSKQLPKYNRKFIGSNISAIGDVCTGCSACVNVCPVSAINMVKDDNEFLYPQIDNDKCIECGKCLLSCHTNKVIEPNRFDSVYYGWNNDAQIRKNSSSGGVFAAFAQKVIDDGGVAFGAFFDANTKIVRHTSTDEVPLESLLKSKYVESEIGDSMHILTNIIVLELKSTSRNIIASALL